MFFYGAPWLMFVARMIDDDLVNAHAIGFDLYSLLKSRTTLEHYMARVRTQHVNTTRPDKRNARSQPYKKKPQGTQSLSPAYENVAHTCRDRRAHRRREAAVVMSSHRALPPSLVFWAAGGRLDLGHAVTLSLLPDLDQGGGNVVSVMYDGVHREYRYERV